MSKIKIGKGRSSFLLEMGCISFCIWMDTESIYNRMMHCHEQSYSSRPVPDPDVLVVVTAFCGKMPVYTQYIHTYIPYSLEHSGSQFSEIHLCFKFKRWIRSSCKRQVHTMSNVGCWESSFHLFARLASLVAFSLTHPSNITYAIPLSSTWRLLGDEDKGSKSRSTASTK